MNIVTFKGNVVIDFSKSSGGLRMIPRPGAPYVFSAYQFSKAMEDAVVAHHIERSSTLEPRIRQFNVDPAGGRGRSVLFYTGAGGYGDQVMAWPFARYLHAAGYRVSVLADPGNDVCWFHLPFIEEIIPIPVELSVIERFNHVALAEVVTNMDSHPGQLHPVDAMLHRFGVDYRHVPPAKKCVPAALGPGELNGAWKVMADLGLKVGARVGLYQLSGSSAMRCMPPPQSRRVLFALADAFPAVLWLGLYDTRTDPAYFEPAPHDCPKNVRFHMFAELRQLWAAAHIACVGVSPDSLLAHLMGSLGQPCVSYWGSMEPTLRVQYYAQALPIWPRGACPASPCRAYAPTFAHCPPAIQDRKTCDVIAAVSADDIVGAVKSILL